MEAKRAKLRSPWLLAMAVGMALPGCRQEQIAFELIEPPATPLRPVRVLIGSRVERIHIRADTALALAHDDGVVVAELTSPAGLFVSLDRQGGWRFDEKAFTGGAILVRPKDAGNLHITVERDRSSTRSTEYPGVVRLVRVDGDRFDIVNLVDVEQYVACVVANEVWPSFDTEAYRAQAVASRTFVLYQMERRNDATFDVSATQGSQVYRGIRRDTTGRLALEAARYTRGLTCTCRVGDRDQLFCAYYSAACGGISQSAAIFGPENDVAPLAGGVACDFCKIAPGDAYRWGPVRLTRDELTSRLVAGMPDLVPLGSVQSIAIVERTSKGRPTRLRLTGSSGESRELLAERFRLAVGGNLIRSTNFKLRESDRDLVFEDGRGFGHGLGLCQWGMQGQAKLGKTAAEILRYYYPGSQLTRAY